MVLVLTQSSIRSPQLELYIGAPRCSSPRLDPDFDPDTAPLEPPPSDPAIAPGYDPEFDPGIEPVPDVVERGELSS
jgi:hypothetical protein